MKKQKAVVFILALSMISVVSFSQKGKVVLHTDEVPEVTHVHVDDFPKDMVLPHLNGWGGMTVDINNAPAGTDFTPLLAGLENDKCQVPHWGYVVKGAVRIIYEDDKEEVFSEGEAFYMKPGHTAKVEKDLLLVSFSPEDGFHSLADHIDKKVAEMQEHQH